MMGEGEGEGDGGAPTELVGDGEPEVCSGDGEREGFGFDVELLAYVPRAGCARTESDLCRARPRSDALCEGAAAAG